MVENIKIILSCQKENGRHSFKWLGLKKNSLNTLSNAVLTNNAIIRPYVLRYTGIVNKQRVHKQSNPV
jgi:hypothetical protein